MSIQSEIERINYNVSSAYSAVQEKGGTVPQEANSDNLPAAISTIPEMEGIPVKPVTESEYDALSEEEKNGETAWLVTDAEGGGSGGQNVPSGIPSGFIGIWSGSSDNIPDGWALCDGTNNTPDMRGRFVMGANEAHAIGQTGGEEEVTLTIEQMPYHSHISSYRGTDSIRVSASGSGSTYASNNGQTTRETTYAGSSQPHNNLPPYYVLCYIMKL